MGRLKVIKAGPLATIQDFGRFGSRRYGVPQAGAMDRESMIAANQLVGNEAHFPVVELAIKGMVLETIEETKISVVGASIMVNDEPCHENHFLLKKGDSLEVSAPNNVYGYLGIGGVLQAKEDFGSVSTYLLAGFGGIEGKVLKAGDELITQRTPGKSVSKELPDRVRNDSTVIRIMKGPEWDYLKELPDSKTYVVDPTSNRMGIRLNGTIESDYREISSSAVIPGTIQLPADGQPIVLMNDCQTTGGYPRIGKVIDEDLGKLAQVRSGLQVSFEIS